MKYVNIYKDGQGRFLGDDEYDSPNEAFENRDDLSTYIETVGIVRTEASPNAVKLGCE